MSNYIVSDSDLTSIANAIRTKGGTSAQLPFPTGFVSAIGEIKSGGVELQPPIKVVSGQFTVASTTKTVTISLGDSGITTCILWYMFSEDYANARTTYADYKRVVVRGHLFRPQATVPYGSNIQNIVEINASGNYENWTASSVSISGNTLTYSSGRDDTKMKPGVPMNYIVVGR